MGRQMERQAGWSAGHHYYAGPSLPVFLLTVFAKGERTNLTKAERNELRQVLATLAAAYRERAN
jgi:hypothetical protein